MEEIRLESKEQFPSQSENLSRCIEGLWAGVVFCILYEILKLWEGRRQSLMSRHFAFDWNPAPFTFSCDIEQHSVAQARSLSHRKYFAHFSNC